MKRILFIDRDGTILREPADEQIDSFEKFEFLPGAIRSLSAICRSTDFDLVMVTNQDGLGTSSFPEETFWPIQEKMLAILSGEGVRFSEILIDRSFPTDNAPTRKPRTGLVEHYRNSGHDLAGSYVIGDRLTDIEFARNLGANAIHIVEEARSGNASGKGDPVALSSASSAPSSTSSSSLSTPASAPVISVSSWHQIEQHLLSEPRKASVHRKTSETDIAIEICLDGSGTSSISTGLGFFDHMLDQLARHSGIDLSVKTTGDLHIDEHHTVEDTALALGMAFDKALGSKRGIGRYGFMLPMDDALAQVAIDLGGRPWLVWEAEFKREKIGDVPTELFSHFFKSFTDTARCTLNVKAEGDNEHHKIEAVFKGFARALRQAIARDGSAVLPSTKGVL